MLLKSRFTGEDFREFGFDLLRESSNSHRTLGATDHVKCLTEMAGPLVSDMEMVEGLD